MKRCMLLALVLCLAAALSAQGMWFEGSVGGGFANTSFGDIDESASGFGLEIGVRAGYGPLFDLGGMPAHGTFELSYYGGGGDEFDLGYLGKAEYSTSSFFIAPGLLLYPTEKFQVGLAAGLANVSVTAKATVMGYSAESTASEMGFGVNLSGAYELGQMGESGLLVGGRLYYNSADEVGTLYIGAFLKYRFNL